MCVYIYMCVCVYIYIYVCVCVCIEGVRAKKLQATLLFVDFTKAFDSIH